MNAARSVRAVALPGVAWARPNLGRWAVRGFVFAFCLASALLLTALRLEITRLEYELSTLHGQRQVLTTEVARLGVEAAALAAPRRIERRARRLGYVYPDRKSVVVLDE